MALPRHDAANRQQRSGPKSKFVSAQNGRQNNIACKFQASVHAERETRTEASANQSVMCFAQPNFPRQTRILDRRKWRRSGSTVVAADGDDVGASLRNTRGNNSYSRAGHQLHADSRVGIYRPQIMNQLRQVFDTVNIMMRWRRNQRRSRRRVADAG